GLLLADSSEQVQGWGRPVFTRRWSTTAPRERPSAATLAATGYRVGLTAVAIAVLLPTIVPGIHPRGMFGMGGAGGRGSGSQSVTTPDPLVSLKRELTRQDDAVVLTYRTDDRERPDYLRMYALDRFDGDRWTYSALQSTARDRIGDGALPPAPGTGSAPTRPVSTRIEVDDRVKEMTFLPMPYPPLQVAIKGDWRVDPQSLMVYSLRDAAGGRAYTVNSLRVQPTDTQLTAASEQAPPDITRRYLAIPREVPEGIRRLAMSKSAEGASLYEKAVKLQQWFTDSGEFTYDLSRQSPKHVSDLVDFLTVSKKGYCEQFAASMALLARTLGIPARVAMGYTAGSQAPDGSWVVRSRDAHAWPELYFEGVGWVRFEPTPSGGLGQGTASVPPYTQPVAAEEPVPGDQASPTPSESAGADSSASPGVTPGRRPDDLGQTGAGDLSDTSGGWWISPAWIAGVPLLLLIMAMPMSVAALSRRRRWERAGYSLASGRARPGKAAEWPAERHDELLRQRARDRANAAWTQLKADAIDHRLPWRTNESPRATSRRLAEHVRLDTAAVDALTRIALAEERARYAPDPADMDSLRGDSRLVRDAFARSVTGRTRWRARLMPPSALASFRRAGGRALYAIDMLSALGTRLTRPRRRG
ncbi:transglutaminaseTgpA domain-containing protein, partial [Actinomadura sp. HBU206391]|uniref:transglutaminase family protein n=1 Tax=Actinomadura sp. HBU206391 TaxID=2731692 RepID=UPI00165093EB